MIFEGSCVAVYSLRSYANILIAIKQLQAVGYSANQLSVIGRKSNNTLQRRGLFSLGKILRSNKKDKYFWDNLRNLLKDEIFYKTSEDDSIEVRGELSHANIKQNQPHSYADIVKLLYSVGIPKVSFEYYESVLKNGQLLLIIHANYQQLKRAGNLLDLSGDINVSLHLAINS